MSFLLDTNVVSEPTKPRPDPGLASWLASVDEDQTFLSAVTLAEISFGIERRETGERRAKLERWLNGDVKVRFAGRILPVDEAVAEAWGKVVAARAALGRPIGLMDGFIAATALVSGLTLVTRNTADFENTVPALLNPWRNGQN
jgi:predicted nucleic acid-binding protein